MRTILGLILTLSVLWSCNSVEFSHYSNRENLFNDGWEFVKDVEEEDVWQNRVEWEIVNLPHTANIEPLVIKGRQWMGTSYYRKRFIVPTEKHGKHLALHFEGAMHLSDIYINGNRVKTSYSGYLPFYAELTEYLKYGEENTVLLKVNNEDNPKVPPGKPVDELDFNYFSGIYRNVWFLVKEKLHISDPIGANRIAGGGVLVTYSDVSNEHATVNVQVDVNNEYSEDKKAQIRLQLSNGNNRVIKDVTSDVDIISGGGNRLFKLSFGVENPDLWSPSSPSLYQLHVSLVKDNQLIDKVSERIGIRTFTFSTDGFELNGEPLFLRGTNRHQEYPYVGYAISDNANYRDAYKIRKAGFNFVRLSHYPHTKSFIDACDELGLLVMNAIPGWQFFGDDVFYANSINDVRKMVRRDRNHPSIILWEASLNESEMPKQYMFDAHNAVYEEFPSYDLYTCSWYEDIYDVFIPARQHGYPPHYWNHYDKKPILIAEYGDWEYYAHNAGFNQTAFEDLTPEERNSRQLRGFGQRRLAQQALNYQESHNSNLKGSPAGDANWLMFDYNRGYAPDLEASGIMDIFRLPKFAFYFYKSQAAIGEFPQKEFNKPFVYIANYYNDPSFLDVKIYSNCEEIELFVNGQSLGRQFPDEDANSTHLNQPPFTFILNSFSPGELKAVGYINEKAVVESIRRTPGYPKEVKLWIDESNRPLTKSVNDIVFLYAAIVDDYGVIISEAVNSVEFSVSGDATLIGMNPIEAEAGIATILLQAGQKGGVLNLTATSNGLLKGELSLEVK
ncbi:glycoside hydrolase family 2 TIM barrel-domain containing protein [Natronoflexus pectinivorans]|uniref:Beta-galactosidase n=1 Tax=Natronoflexus pectinivorans TaxID=682526 RepID=A0A4V2RW79_9BACT|nr:glycoside hydrolase family 2 TIM barrel-domain containing protein [Natronoflexus pectinivorans]TCO07202.1 beta-galactosidase [Natronoflexus pectinivorans]